ncbi:hypothetical protein J0H33_06345, partial [bacterium]|nr:hypothetical protein [bacterium]
MTQRIHLAAILEREGKLLLVRPQIGAPWELPGRAFGDDADDMDAAIAAELLMLGVTAPNIEEDFFETVFLGEDTVFDGKVRKLVAPAFAERAKAFYHPRHSFRSAVRQLASYSITDGVLGVRPARLARNLARCVAEVLAIVALWWTPIPFAVVLVLENYFAFR